MQENKTGISRRNFLAGTGAALGAFAAGSLFGANVEKAEAAEMTLPLPWPTNLNVDTVRNNAYNGYLNLLYPGVGSGCCFGTAAGTIKAVKEALGASSWDDLPIDMYNWGAGGGHGWGTICGSLNGALSIINLAAPNDANGNSTRGVLSDALMNWYANNQLPTDATQTAIGETLTKSVCYSPLCHASVSTWCGTTGFAIGDTERKHRCAQVAADCAGKAVELLTDAHNGIFPAGWTPDPRYASCYDCHEPGDIPAQQGKMDCTQCHDDGGVNKAPGCTKPE